MKSCLLPIHSKNSSWRGDLDKKIIGGKGVSLVKLARAGVSIPDTWVVPVEVMRVVCDKIEPDIPSMLSQIPSLLYDELRRINENYHGKWMVRSSAVDEDGEEKSFAGQYTSVCGVHDLGGLLEAIVTVWKSYFADHVQEYHMHSRRGMAVLIQKEIEAKYAGVLFTNNPTTGVSSELVLESIEGHGEQVVSASVVPGRAIFWAPPSLRSFLTRFSRALIPKKVYQSDSLPTLVLQREICRLGCVMEIHEGMAVDMEWVISQSDVLYFVQMRPITTTSRRDVLWTRQFLGERWTIPATELGWSEIEHVMNPLIDYRQTHDKYLGGEKAARLFQYSPFLNATVFRHLLFRLPGVAPMPAFFLEMLPSHEQKKWTDSFFVAPGWKVYASIIKTTIQEQRWKRFRWNPWTNHQKWDGFQLRLESFLHQNTSQIQEVSQAKERLSRCRDMTMEYLKVHVCSLIYANLWHQWAIWYLQEKQREDLIPIVVRSHQPTATQRANTALWKLGNGEMTREELLEEFGVRSENSWSLFAPRWCESPEHVDMLASWMKGTPNPQEESREVFRRLEQAMCDFSSGLRSNMRIVQKYLFLREEQRYFFEKLLWIWKKTWLWIEENEGLRLRHLTLNEVERYWKGTYPQAKQIIESRKASWSEACRSWSKDGPPAQFLIGDEPVHTSTYEEEYLGIGISSGFVQGSVCIVRSIDDAKNLREGDILVVSTLDPGWTSLLIKARGIVMELGGMLSHGAVIAREYGVPAVAAVDQACSLFRTGEEIAIDGKQGRVWRC